MCFLTYHNVITYFAWSFHHEHELVRIALCFNLKTIEYVVIFRYNLHIAVVYSQTIVAQNGEIKAEKNQEIFI